MLSGLIEEKTMAEKGQELPDRVAKFIVQLAACDPGRHEPGEIEMKAFELSQNLRGKWLTAHHSGERQYLEFVFLNLVLDGVTLVPTKRKPFDVLAEGLISRNSQDDTIWT